MRRRESPGEQGRREGLSQEKVQNEVEGPQAEQEMQTGPQGSLQEQSKGLAHGAF